MRKNTLTALLLITFAVPAPANARNLMGRVQHWYANQRALRRANPTKIKDWRMSNALSAMKTANQVYKDPQATRGQKRRALHFMRKTYFGALVTSARFKTDSAGHLHPNFNSSAILTSTTAGFLRAKALRRKVGISVKLLTTRQPIDSARTARKVRSVNSALGFVNGLLRETMHARRASLKIDAARAAKGLEPRPNEIRERTTGRKALRALATGPTGGAPAW